jgi:hypothetical protein
MKVDQMELVARHRQWPLHQFLVRQVLHLNHLELKVLQELRLVGQLALQVQPAQRVQVQEELALQEQQVQEELLEEPDQELRRRHQCLLGPVL